ncbi:hypothetical protein FCV25MIE_28089, partial [Fagus crenata]
MCCGEATRLGGRLYDRDGGFVLRGVAGGVGLCFSVWPVGWVSASRFGRWA